MKSAIVVGGSLTGLMAAIVLRDQGYEVRVLERSSPEDLQSQAAGMRAGPETVAFIKRYIKDPSEYYISIGSIEYVDEEGNTVAKQALGRPMPSTTWFALYKMCKKELLTKAVDASAANYETHQSVESIRSEADVVVVTSRDGASGALKEFKANLVIGADGANSLVRKSFLPDSQPTYAGYVSWRGRVPEETIQEETRKRLQNQIVLHRINGEYFISYYVKADQDDQRREFVWIWYSFLQAESNDYNEAMTDTNGRRRFGTVPSGKVRPQVWEKKLAEAREVANSMFVELLQNTEEPFLSAIRDRSPSKAVFADGKVILLGDALSLARPHSGSSTNTAASQTLHFAKVLEGTLSLDRWEQEMIEQARVAHEFSISMGDFFFTGKINPSAQEFIKRNSAL